MHIEKWRGFFGFLFYLELQDAKKKMLNLVWHSQIWKKEKNTAPESHEIKQQKYVTTTKSHSWPFQARLILLKSRVNANGWTIVTRNLPLQNWNEPTRENKTLLSLWIPSHEEDSWISIIRKMLSRMKVHPKRHQCMYVSRYFLLVQFSSSWFPYPLERKENRLHVQNIVWQFILAVFFKEHLVSMLCLQTCTQVKSTMCLPWSSHDNEFCV